MKKALLLLLITLAASIAAVAQEYWLPSARLIAKAFIRRLCKFRHLQ